VREEVINVCGKAKTKCEHPERLKGDPKNCSPEQIKKCHGDVKKHRCVSGSKK